MARKPGWDDDESLPGSESSEDTGEDSDDGTVASIASDLRASAVELLDPRIMADFAGVDLPDYHYVASHGIPNFIGIDPAHYLVLLHRSGLLPAGAGKDERAIECTSALIAMLESMRFRTEFVMPRVQLAIRTVPYAVVAKPVEPEMLASFMNAAIYFARVASPVPKLAVDFITSFLVIASTCSKSIEPSCDAAFAFCLDAVTYVVQPAVMASVAFAKVDRCLSMAGTLIDAVATSPTRIKKVLGIFSAFGLDNVGQFLERKAKHADATPRTRHGSPWNPSCIAEASTIEIGMAWRPRLEGEAADLDTEHPLHDALALLLATRRGLRVDKALGSRLEAALGLLLAACADPKEQVEVGVAMFENIERGSRIAAPAQTSLVRMAAMVLDQLLATWETGTIENNDAIEIAGQILAVVAHVRREPARIVTVVSPFLAGTRWKVLHWVTNGTWRCDGKSRAVRSKAPLFSTVDLELVASMAERIASKKHDGDPADLGLRLGTFLAAWHDIGTSGNAAIPALAEATRSMLDMVEPGRHCQQSPESTLDTWIAAFGQATNPARFLDLDPRSWLGAARLARHVTLESMNSISIPGLTRDFFKIVASACLQDGRDDDAVCMLDVTYAWAESLAVPVEETTDNLMALRDAILVKAGGFRAMSTVLARHNRFIARVVTPYYASRKPEVARQEQEE